MFNTKKKIQFYLVITRQYDYRLKRFDNWNVRALKTKPEKLKWNEISISIKTEIDDQWFIRPRFEAELEIPEPIQIPFPLLEIQKSIRGLGMDIEIKPNQELEKKIKDDELNGRK